MSCCGQKRTALASSVMRGRGRSSLVPKPDLPAAPEAGPETGDCRVRYVGAQPLSLRGPQSGRTYYFAEAGKTAIVDKRDIEALLRSRLFVRDSAPR